MTRVEQHDAQWQLQRELYINDMIVEGERRKRRTRPGSERLETVIVVFDPEPGEVEAALRMVDRIADRTGLSRDGLAEVLDALGLTGQRTLSRIRRVQADRAKPIARCSHCGNRTRTRADGSFVSHPFKTHQRAEDDPCPGGGTKDRAEEVA